MFRKVLIARILLLTIASFSCTVAGHARQPGRTKVSCIGDSITYGMNLEDRERDSYPSRLQALLGDDYEVENFGKSGTTLLRHGHRPYFEQEEMHKALDFAGDIVVIHLGINDTDPRNWPFFQEEFVGDYLALIDTLRCVNPAARFYVCRMTPIGNGHPRFISGTKVWHTQIQRAIETVATVSGATLVDLYEPLHNYPWLLPDNVHPSAEGAMMIATKVYQSITGDFGGLDMSPLYSDNMVLPRDREFTIHGMSNPGEEVIVYVCGRQFKGRTGDNGRWSIVMGPFPASQGNSMSVRTKNRKLDFKDVAFGEIWLCSGQSNMEFEQGFCSTAGDSDKSADSGLRLFDMKCRWRTDDVQWPVAALDSVAHLQYMRPAAWREAVPETVRRFSAVGYYFGRALRDSLGVPVGLICNAVGGSTAESWISREILENEFPAILDNWLDNDLVMSWARSRARKNLSASGTHRRHPYEPCYLHEAAIIPLEDFPVNGVIWYQGESNADRIEVHEKLFPLLVDSFREAFGPVSFHFAQLSSLDRKSWPLMRDSQRRLLGCRDRLTMTVTSDLGDSLDVHYKNKRPVGERFALAALAKDYGREDLEYSGPLADRAFLESPSLLRITFTHSAGLKAAPNTGNRISGFEVLDMATGLFTEVDAWADGESVIADVSTISRPTAVRYGWKPFSRANLVNDADLPASTVRVDIGCPPPRTPSGRTPL